MASRDYTSEMKRVVDEAARLSKEGLFKASEKDFKRLQAQMDSFAKVTDSIAKARNIGFKQTSKELMEIQRRLSGAQADFTRKMSRELSTLQAATDKKAKAAAAKRIASLKKEYAARFKEEKKFALKRTKLANEQAEAAKKFRNRKKLKLSDLPALIGSGGNTALGALSGQADIGDLITGAVNKAGGRLGGMAASRAASAGGDITGMTRALGGLGKGLMGVGVALGSAFALFKIFQAIEGSGKKINKELLEGAGATDLMAVGSNSFYHAINEARRAFTRADFANEMGMTTDEVIKTVGELSKMGFTLREMEGDAQAMKDLIKGMREASVGLGIGMNEAGEYASRFKFELGLAVKDGSFLGRMANEFANIRDMALQSGYSTSQFFNKIKDLTDGMGKMNVRTIEAGKILLSLSKVLGPEAAQNFTKGLIGAFGQESYVDRIKRLMTTGGRGMSRALEGSARATAAQFSRDFLSEGSGLGGILGQFGINKGDVLGGVRGLSRQQQQELLGALQAQGTEGQGASRALLRLLDISGGRGKGMMGRVRALGALDAGGTLSAQVQRVMGFTGGKSVRDASLGQLQLLQSLGFSQEQLEQIGQIQTLKGAEFERVRRSGGATNEEMAQLGVEMRDGRLFNKETGMAIENLGDYLQAQGAQIDEMGKNLQAPTLESIMQDSVLATQTTADKINNHLGQIMQGVYDVTIGIYEWLFNKAQSEDSRAAQRSATSQLEETLRASSERELEINREIRELQSQMQGKSVEERARLQAEIAAKINRREQVQTQRQVDQESLRYLRSTKLTDETDPSQMITRARSRGVGLVASRGVDVSGITGAHQQDMVALASFLQQKTGRGLRESLNILRDGEDEDKERLKGILQQGGYSVDRNNRFIRRGGDVVAGRGSVSTGRSVNQTYEMPDGRFYTRPVQEKRDIDRRDITVTPNPNAPEARRERDLTQAATQDAAVAAATDPAVRRENERLQDRELRLKQEMELRGQLASLGVDSRGSIDDVMTRLRAASLTDEQRMGLAPTLARLDSLPALNDGFISQGGAVRRISSMDDVLAFKSGGPVDRALGGGRASITININGNAPDLEARVQRAIHKTMRESGVVVEG